MSQGWQKHFSFDQTKYSAGIMHLCRSCEAADYPYKALNNFDGIMLLIYITKVEMFIHVAIQNFTMRVLYTELRITAGQLTISNRLCCMSNNISEICNAIWSNLT